ncbi:RNA polymerase sigma factor [uncultured Duncaniella sp.]|uniref:RNA polymerase sigma factor n=1 Tax=uncultured Duncaniella sp. TaxID=2768039 RepID=UPI0025EF4778|nr:sigma-70 family RNA polymerase sigma factor [uncultured Duncaniella sp.]
MLSADAIFHNFITGKMTPFYDRYYPGLLMYARRVLLDSELEWMAEDCVQEAVMDAFQKRHIFNDPAQWHAHMLACIRNKAISARRRLSARRNYEENMSAGSDSRNPEPDITHALIEHETLDALYAAIKSLPPNYRELLSMSFEEGLKNAEIAARLGVSEITVKKRKARMLEMLRSRLGGEIDLLTITILLSAYLLRTH